MEPVAVPELPDGASDIGTDKTESFPLALVIAIVVLVAIGAGLLVYFKKRKHKVEQ